jgi:HD-GYP domain-containing protein (c-di-GMP phosphodiesterase class II)
VTEEPGGGPSSLRGDQGKRLQDLGQKLLPLLARCIRLTQFHDRGNRALEKPLQDLLVILDELYRFDNRWDLRIRGDHLLLCDLRLRFDADNLLSYRFLADELAKAGIGAIGIHAPSSSGMLLDLLYAVREAGALESGEASLQHLREHITRFGLKAVYLESPAEETGVDPVIEEDVRRRSVTTFFKAIYLTRGILGSVERQKVVHVRRAKRLVASLVDILSLDEGTLLGLTNIKSFDEYTFNHSVNVCVLSLAVGRRIGLSRSQLGELGLAALFHDLGKTIIAPELLNKTERLDAAEVGLFQRHPVEGVKQLIRLKGLTKATAKLMISVFRHHSNVDRSGYPPLRQDEEISLYSRIIRIVDSYDAMTSKRIYRRQALNNVEAIEELWNLAGIHFDTPLLKIFISTVGVYPPGSLVQLNSGEIAVVLKNSRNAENLLRPVVKTLARWDDRPHNPSTIDLGRERNREIYGYFQSSGGETLVPSLLL